MGGIAPGRNSKAVTRCIAKVLFDAQVNLRCDYRGVSKRKLYLFEGCLSSVRELCERSPQVVRAGHHMKLVCIGLHNHKDSLG